MLIYQKGHTDTIQVYSVTVMTHVKALQAGHSSQGHLSLLHRHWLPYLHRPLRVTNSLQISIFIAWEQKAFQTENCEVRNMTITIRG